MGSISFLPLGDVRNYTPSPVSTSEKIGGVMLMRSGTTIWAIVKDVRIASTYKLLYDANGGEGVPEEKSEINKNGSAEFIISSVIPARDGYEFMGWADSADADTAVYKSANRIYLQKGENTEKTIYAVWKPSVYSVMLNTNDGTIADGKNVTSYTYGEGAELPGAGDISYKCHIFDGWYADSGFSGSAVTNISDTSTGNKVFYAKWREHHTPGTVVKENETVASCTTEGSYDSVVYCDICS